MVTDHGHQPQKGFGHGFQTPDETATFVIASGPDFNDGFVNPDYEIVDTTPTVLTLFGAHAAGEFRRRVSDDTRREVMRTPDPAICTRHSRK